MKLTIAFVLGLSLFVSASHGQTQHAPTNRLSNQLQAQADTAWQLVNIGSNTNVYSIDFINADTGWIAGGAGLFMTTDSGNTWLPWGPAGSYRKVQFLNSQIGWVLQSLSSSGMIHTTNGGLTWTNESLRYSPKDVYFINADTGIACRVGEASRTTDGGAHWVDSAVDADNQLCKILSFDQSHLLIVGEPSVWEKQFQLPPVTVFLYSSDAGLTWNRVKFDSAHRALRTGTIHNSKEAIVAGDSIVGHTTDGGQSWTFLSESDILQFASCIVTGDKWYVAGETAFTGSSRILVSTDQGTNWVFQNCPDIGGIVAVAFSTPLIGWAGSADGGLLRTITGGFSSVGSIQSKQNLPVQVFPNPSQKQLQFDYDLPKAESMTLSIYNTTGQLISRPLSDIPQNPGMQQVRVSTGSLKVGDYVFLLTSRDYVQSGRFTAIK
jgi:photosystem II stability/assembly factor-like uncharacterized protein